jgi:nucleotide-binding universal stress UspA family protein
MKRILVPVDFSDCSEAALDHASALARALGATIDILYVWQAPTFLPPELLIAGPGPQQTLTELTHHKAESELAEFAGRARARGAEIGEALVEEGYPAQRIVERADEGNYDLLVIGTHGRTGVSRALLGSTAERVVRHSKKPVLTIRVT